MQAYSAEVKKIEENKLLIAAAEYIYQHFLSKAYKLAPAEKFPKEGAHNGVVIQRPNHALAHTIRTVLYIPAVITAYKFKHPTTKFDTEFENMQLVILFFVVGRESEASFKNDNVNYVKFKQTSAQAYKQFVTTYQDKFPSLKKLIVSGEVERYKAFITGNVGNHDDISQVFTIAHNLDLLRCFNEQKFAVTRNAIRSLLGFVEGDVFGDQVVEGLLCYAKACLKQNGDYILPDNVSRNPEAFVKTNISVRDCLAALRNVNEPKFGSQVSIVNKANPIIASSAPSNKQGVFKATDTSYEKGIEYEKKNNFVEAYNCFYSLAQKGDSNAQFKVGYYRYKGLNGAVDKEGAIKYYSLAAKQGHKDASSRLSLLQNPQQPQPPIAQKSPAKQNANNAGVFKILDPGYQKGLDHEKQKEFKEAYNCFYVLAQKNDANAQYKVGYYRYKGLSGAVDKEGAKRYFELAAKQDHAEAISALQQVKSSAASKGVH